MKVLSSFNRLEVYIYFFTHISFTWQPGLGAISLRDPEKERIPIKVDNPIVELISLFAITAFNEIIAKVWLAFCFTRLISVYVFYLFIFVAALIINIFLLLAC